MQKLTIEEINGLLRNRKFLETLRDRTGSARNPESLKEAQARAAISAIAAIAGKKPRGLGYRLLQMQLAGAIHSYLEAFDEDATTYPPEEHPQASAS
ncbi:MAG TPA: hypothetical protein VL481_01515 [Verrucomicrobiae bacterium]|jgi:hypothetical protein|nr:hypothetical protein [Verrucomicrobiae bacterium]